MWRVLLIVGGVLSVTGGSQHPNAPKDLSFRDNLAVMMEDGAWVPSHALMAVGAFVLLAGFEVVRRGRLWPSAARVLPFAVGAAAAMALELVVHTVAFVDREALADGDSPPVAMTHLALAAVAYPLFGIAIVFLAWCLASSGNPVLRAVAVVGIVGGVANALSVPIAIITQTNTFDFLFPLGAIATALWLLLVGIAGVRTTAPEHATAT